MNIGFLKHEYYELMQQNVNNLFTNIFYAMNAIFICFKHFPSVENVLKKMYHKNRIYEKK